MPSIAVSDAFVAITAADAAGNLTVASANDSAPLYPGTQGWLTKDDASATARVRIVSISVDGLTIVVGRGTDTSQPAVAPNYGRIDVSAFDGGGAHLCIEAQTAPIDPAYSKRIVP